MVVSYKLTMAAKILKFLDFLKRNSSSFGAYDALQHFAMFSEALYSQYFTWERPSWKPIPTRKIKLIPWYFMSLVIILSTFAYSWVVFKEILVHKKDPEMTTMSSLMFPVYICVHCLDVLIIVTFISTVEEICFVLGNLQNMKAGTTDIGGKYISRL